MATLEKRIEATRKKLNQLNNQAKKKQNRAKAAERKERSRALLLWGVALEKMIKTSDESGKVTGFMQRCIDQGFPEDERNREAALNHLNLFITEPAAQ